MRLRNHYFRRKYLLFFSLLLSVGIASAQQSPEDITALRKQVEALQVSHRQLQSDCTLIKNMPLGKQVTPEAPPLQDVTVETAGAAPLGSPEARVVLVEFSDYQCPFCARYSNDTFGRIVKAYVDTGKVQYVFRNFPLREADPTAAEAAKCAGEQGKYWQAHERLFRNQMAVGSTPLGADAASLGFDETCFRSCLQDGNFTARVDADLAEATKIGFNATPTFLIGYREANGSKVRALKKLTGAQPEIAFAQILEYLLDPPPNTGENR